MPEQNVTPDTALICLTDLETAANSILQAIQDANTSGQPIVIDLSALAGNTIDLSTELEIKADVSFSNTNASGMPVTFSGSSWIICSNVTVENVVPPTTYLTSAATLNGNAINADSVHTAFYARSQTDLTDSFGESSDIAALSIDDKLIFDGFTGYLPYADSSSFYVFDYNVEISEGGLSINNGFSRKNQYVFEGTLSGKGDMSYNWAGGSAPHWTFNGDVSAYTGTIKASSVGRSPMQLSFAGDSEMNLGIAIDRSGSQVNISGHRTVNSDIALSEGTLEIAQESEVILNGTVNCSTLATSGSLVMTPSAEVQTETLTVNENSSLNVEAGSVLTINGNVSNAGSMRVDGMLIVGGTLTNTGELQFGENSIVSYTLSIAETAENDIREILVNAESAGAKNIVIDVSVLAGGTLSLTEELVLPMAVEFRNSAEEEVAICGGPVTGESGVSFIGHWNTDELNADAGKVKRMVYLTDESTAEAEILNALQLANGSTAIVFDVSSLAGRTITLSQSLELSAEVEFRNTAEDNVQITGALVSAQSSISFSQGVVQNCLNGNYEGRDSISYDAGYIRTYTPIDADSYIPGEGVSDIWLSGNSVALHREPLVIDSANHIGIVRNTANGGSVDSGASVGGILLGSLSVSSSGGAVDEVEISSNTTSVGAVSLAGVTSSGVSFSNINVLHVEGNSSLASNDALTAEAYGGAFSGSASFTDIATLELIGNRAQGQAVAAGGAIKADQISFSDIGRLLVSGNSTTAAEARGGAFQGSLVLSNVTSAIFKGNAEYSADGVTLRSIYGATASIQLAADQSVLFYDTVYLTDRLTLEAGKNSTLVFSAEEVQATLEALGSSNDVNAIRRSSTSYAANFNIQGGTLSVQAGAVLEGENMTIAAGAQLWISADSSISLSGNLCGEGSVVIDFSNARDGRYNNIISFGSASSQNLAFSYSGLQEGAVCVFYQEENGISAYINSKILHVTSAAAEGEGSLAEALDIATTMDASADFPVYIYLDDVAGQSIDTSTIGSVNASVVLVNRSSETVTLTQALQFNQAATLRNITIAGNLESSQQLTLDGAVIQGDINVLEGSSLSIISDHGSTIVEGSIINSGTLGLDGMLQISGEIISQGDAAVSYGENYGRTIVLTDAATAEEIILGYLSESTNNHVNEYIFDVTALAGQTVELSRATVWKTAAKIVNYGSESVTFTGGYWEVYAALQLHQVNAPSSVTIGAGSLSGGNADSLQEHERLDVTSQAVIGSGIMSEQAASLAENDLLVFNGFSGHFPGTSVEESTYQCVYTSSIVIAEQGITLSNVSSYSNYSFNGAILGTGAISMASSGTHVDNSTLEINGDMSRFYGSIDILAPELRRSLILNGNSNIHASSISLASSSQSIAISGTRTVYTDFLMSQSSLSLMGNSQVTLNGRVESHVLSVASGAQVLANGTDILYNLSIAQNGSFSLGEGASLKVTGTLSNQGTLYIDGDFELRGTLTGEGAVTYGEHSRLICILDDAGMTAENFLALIRDAEAAGAVNMLIDATALAGRTLDLGEDLATTLSLQLINTADEPITLSGGTISSSSSLALQNINVSGVTAAAGTSLELKGCRVNGEFILSADASLSLSGNDFSNATIAITEGSDDKMIDLSGNEWGTEKYAEIFSILGDAAPYVTIDGHVSTEFISPELITVTNVSSSPEHVCSLLWAINRRNSNDTNSMTRIVFEDDLADQTIVLLEKLIVNKPSALIAPEGGVIIESGMIQGGGLVAEASVELHHITIPYIEIKGEALLDSVTVERLELYPTSSISSMGAGLALTGLEAFRLHDWSGDIGTLLGSFQWNATEENWQIGLDGDLGSANLQNEVAGHAATYVISAATNLLDGEILALEDGSKLHFSDAGNVQLTVNGTLRAVFGADSDALVAANGGCCTISNGGIIELTHANLNMGDNSRLDIASGGQLSMTGGILDTGCETVNLEAGGRAMLASAIVQSGLTVHGSLTTSDSTSLKNIDLGGEGQASLANSVITGDLTVHAGATLELSNSKVKGGLSLSLGADYGRITDNDFSKTQVVITDISAAAGRVIDLSGNYWGTTDLNEIISRIQGYDEAYVVLDSCLAAREYDDFCFLKLKESGILTAKSDSLTLVFTHRVDASSITADNLYLEDSEGRRIAITSTTASDTSLTIHFEPLLSDGVYKLVVGDSIVNEYGSSLAMEEGTSQICEELTVDVTVESIVRVSLEPGTAPTYLDVAFSGSINIGAALADHFSVNAPDGTALTISGCEMVSDNVLRLHVGSLPTAGDYLLTLPEDLSDAAGNIVQQAGIPYAFTVTSADVHMESSSLEYSSMVTGSVLVEALLRNNGNTAATNSTVEIWLTLDGNITDESVLLDSYVVPNMSANSMLQLQRELTLPSTVEEGNYQLAARVINSSELETLQADNKAIIGSLAVSYPPASDLSITGMTLPDFLIPGSPLEIGITLSNLGNAELDGEVFLSLSMVADGADASTAVSLGRYALQNGNLQLIAGESIEMSVPGVMLPKALGLSGMVRIIATLELSDAIYERPEHTSNNVMVSMDALQLSQNLFLELSGNSISEGSSIRRTLTLTRSGDCSEDLVVRLDAGEASRLNLPETITIAAGSSWASCKVSVADDDVFTGSTISRISATAEGYVSSSATLEVLDDEKATLTLTLSANNAREGEILTGTVTMDAVSTTDTVIKLGSTLSSQITMPATVTILAGQTSASFDIRVVNDEVAEIDKALKITAAADGFNSGSAELTVVDDDLPQVQLELSKDIVSESDGYYAITGTLVRSGGSLEAITVKLQDVDGIGLILPASVPMGAGVTSVKFTIGVVDDALANGERTGTIRGTITIDDCGCDASSSALGGVFETTLTVQDNDSPALRISLSKTVLREGGEETAVLTVTSNYVSDQDVFVTLSDAGLLNLPAGITIPAGQKSVTCEVTAMADGVADGTQYTTIVAAADGFVSGHAYMQVTDMDVPDLVVDSIAMDGAAIAGQKITMNVVLRNQGYASTSQPVTAEITLSDGTKLGSVSTTEAVAVGEKVMLQTEVTLPAVSGNYIINAVVDSSNAVAELEENNNFGPGIPVVIGSGYSIDAQIEEDVLYSSGTVHFSGKLTADAGGLPVGGQTVNLYLYRNGNLIRTIEATTEENGSYAVEYSVPSGIAGKYELRAGVYSDKSDVLDAFDVAGLRLNTNSKYLQWLVELGDRRSGEITITNTGSVDLHQVTLTALGLPSNISMEFDTEALDIGANESATFHYTIEGIDITQGEHYSDVALQVSSAEGTTLDIKGYSYVSSPYANLSLSTKHFDLTATSTGVRYVEVTVTNTGKADTGEVTVSLPNIDWMSIYSGGRIANLSSDQSATVVLKVDASQSDVTYNVPFVGSLAINAENAQGKKVDFDVTFVSQETASVTVNVTDGFSLALKDNQKIAGARVRIYNAYTQKLEASGYADENGHIVFSGLSAGQYYMYVDADNCERYKANISLEAGEDETINAYLNNTSIEYTFNVVPSEIEDSYEIVQEATYTTNVPAAVMAFEDSVIQIPDIHYGETIYFSFSVTNYGLVAAEDYYLQLPDLEHLTLTLLNPVDRIEAQSSYEFWVQATADSIEPEDKSGLYLWDLVMCVMGTGIQWWVDCTSNGHWRVNTAVIQTNQENCDNLGSGPGKPRPVGPDDPPDAPPIVPPKKPKPTPGEEKPEDPIPPGKPIVVEEGTCTPGKAAIVNLIADISGWNQITIGDVLSIVAGRFGFITSLPKVFNFSKYLPTADKLLKKIKDADKLLNGCLAYKTRLLQIISVAKLCIEEQMADSPAKDWLLTVCDKAREGIELCDQVIQGIGAATNPVFREVIGALADAIDQVENLDVGDVALYIADLGESCLEFMEKLQTHVSASNGGKAGDSDEVIAIRISAAAREELDALDFSQLVGVDVLHSFYDRWNRTLDYADRNIHSIKDVPEGESTDFFSEEYINNTTAEISDLSDLINTSGAELAEDLIAGIDQSLQDFANAEGDDVCAAVKIKFTQSAVMTREAFEGTMTLSNGTSMGDLRDISFRVYVHDMNGVDVTDHFRITYHSIDGIESFVTGDGGLHGGTLGSGEAGEVYIQYIPDTSVAQQGSQNYKFGAELSYTDPGTGAAREVIMTPVTLTVNPSPILEMHYFLSEDVYSDDPYSEQIEAPMTAEIGYMVKNKGNGIAKNFTMSDIRYDFTENEQGLALELEMLGSSLNGGAIQHSGMSLSFGNLEAGSCNTAIWYFQTNLHGHFSDYSANYTRVDSMGDEAFMTTGTDVSLIESVTTHMLTRSMDADGDGKTDFLVNDETDAYNMADGLYFGNGQYEEVQGIMFASSSSGSLGNGSNTIVMTAKVAEGWNYIRINDPGEGNYRIVGISVGGTELDPSMFWQTDRIFAPDGSASYVDRLHWVYEAAADGYVEFALTYDPVDEKAPTVESFEGVTDKTTVRNAVEAVTVVFSEAVNPNTFSLENVRLRLQNTDVDLTGLAWEWVDDKTLRLTNLANYTQNDGLYVLQVLNGGVADVYGNAGDGSGRQVMWTKATNKVAVELLAGYESVRPNTRVGTLTVTFTESVSSFDASALHVFYTDMAGIQSEVADLSSLEIAKVDSDGYQYEIRGLEKIQGHGDGSYSLFVDGERVVDAFGSAGTGSQSVVWELHETPPTIVDAALDETEALMQSIDTFAMQFSHGVAALDLSACRLTCNGTEYTTDGLVYSIDAADPSRVVITGLSRAVRADGAKGGAVPDGVWELQIDMGGVEDIYGNTGDGVYSKEWEVDTTAPEKLRGITLNGKESLVVADACVTLGAVLTEEGLTVSIYDKSAIQRGRGTLLWQGVAEASTLEQKITLQNGGSRVLTVVTTDAAGNATENVYNVLVDVVALSVTTDLTEGYQEVPEAVRITFNAAVTDFPIEAISLTANGRLVSLEDATLTQISETEWELRGLPALVTEAGSYALSINRSALAKKASGLQGQGIYTQGFEFDSVTEVNVADCRINASAGKISGLDITFSTDINFDDLATEELLLQAFRLVKQSDGSIIQLEGGTFSYANKTLTWSGQQALESGEYAVMIDSRLVTASNGSPLKGNEAGGFGGVAYASAPERLAVEGASYAAPYAYDWNGDGFTDLLVGEKTPDNQGKVKIYLNDGAGNYGAATYVQADGGDLAVSASGCQGIVVAMQDMDGDGLEDLVAGLSDGAVYIYTARESGIFGAGTAMLDENGHPITTGSRAYPTFFDYTGDGVADLILGAGDGRLLAAVGKATEQGGLTFAAAQEIEGVTVSGRAAPQFADVNGDGLADLLAGDEDGNLNLFYNNGEGYVSVSQWSLDGVSWERSRITIADLNNDGLQDLIVGGSTGEVYAVYGHRAPDWGQLFDVSSEPTLSNLTAKAEGNNLALAWEANGAEGFSYRLQISRTEDFANATTHDGIADSHYTIPDLEDGFYYWRIQLVDAQGASVGDWADGSPAIVDTTPPEQPIGLMSEAGEAKAVLTWDALPDAAGGYYEVRYSRQADFAESVTMRTDSANLSLSDLEAGLWHWQVRAVDAAGNEGAWSLPSSFACEEAVQMLHVAQGLTTVDGKITGGYYDVNKTGLEDSNLCWAATSANMLAWWQQQHGNAIGISTSVPATSEAIYGNFAANWDNTSGREEYGLTWWLSGESNSQKYQDFYMAHHVGGGAEGGAWFSNLYDADNISSMVSENSLATVTATELAGTWEAVFEQGGILSLGVYKNISSSGTTGGHSLTLWGFSVYQSTGLLSSVTVSDSDDGLTGLCTLALAYNEARNLYQLTSPGSLNGYYLGDYTVLNGYKDIFNPNVTLSTEVQEKIGEGKTRVTLSWTANEAASFTLVVDGTSYEVGDATSWTVEVDDGEHSYRVEAADAAGNAGLAEGTFRTDATAPDAVANLTAVVRDGAVHFEWEPAADDSDVAYELEYAFNAGFEGAQSVPGIVGTSYVLPVDQATGRIYWRVKATDASGNISVWSETAESPLDVVAPELPAAGLAVVAHGTAARLSWEAAQDASGIAGYVLEYATSEDFGGDVQRMRVSGPEAVFYTLAENTAYYWRVAAVDGAGNVGVWATGSPFHTGVANVADDSADEARRLEMSAPAGGESHSLAAVRDWVGFDDASDFYFFTAKGAGSYSIGLAGDVPLGTSVCLSVGMLDETGAFRSEYSLVAGPGSATTALAGIRLEEGQDCYIRVSAYDNGLGRYNGEYSLEVKADVPDAGTQLTDNNSIQTATQLVASGQAPSEALSGWVGVGDAVDYYRLELAEAGSLKLNLSGLEAAAKIKVYAENAEGGTRQIFSRTVKAASGLVDQTLSLTSGAYYVSIASYDNGAGRYNTGYALELEHEGTNRDKTRYALACK